MVKRLAGVWKINQKYSITLSDLKFTYWKMDEVWSVAKNILFIFLASDTFF